MQKRDGRSIPDAALEVLRERAVAMHEAGNAQLAIAAALGLHKNTVHRWLKRAGGLPASLPSRPRFIDVATGRGRTRRASSLAPSSSSVCAPITGRRCFSPSHNRSPDHALGACPRMADSGIVVGRVWDERGCVERPHAAARCSLRRLCTVQTIAHSALTWSRPRRRNCRKPRACLICPNTGSTTCLRSR